MIRQEVSNQERDASPNRSANDRENVHAETHVDILPVSKDIQNSRDETSNELSGDPNHDKSDLHHKRLATLRPQHLSHFWTQGDHDQDLSHQHIPKFSDDEGRSAAKLVE